MTKKVPLVFGDSATFQEHKDECDINKIINRYSSSGVMPHVKYMEDSNLCYRDISDLPDYLTAMDTVARIDEMFASLPATLRDRFGNDPREFVAYVKDPSSREELEKLGLSKFIEPQASPVSDSDKNSEVSTSDSVKNGTKKSTVKGDENRSKN